MGIELLDCVLTLIDEYNTHCINNQINNWNHPNSKIHPIFSNYHLKCGIGENLEVKEEGKEMTIWVLHCCEHLGPFCDVMGTQKKEGIPSLPE